MKQILYLGNKLEKHGASPTSIDTLPPLLQQEGYRITSVSSIENKPLRLFHMLGSIIFIKKKDLVLIDTYSTSNFWYAVLSAKLSQLLSIPYIFILHGGNLEERFANSSERILKLFRTARANVVPSYYLKEKLEVFNFGNMICIPNSIELGNYEFKKRNSLKPKLLWVRAFDKVYNPGMVLEVCEKLTKNYPNVEVCMVGPEKDGSLKRLQRISKDKNLNVSFEGKLSKEEWKKLAIEFDIFINTSNIDNTPVSVIEAMALGLTVVSTNVGGLPYLISHEENGFLVNPGQPKDMAAAIERLLEDSALAERLSVNGRTKAEEFNWTQVKRSWLELLG